MEIRLAEEQAVINHVHDLCDKMIGRYYSHDERIVKIIEVHTDGRTVTFNTNLGDIVGLLADDIAQEVKEFKPENIRHIIATDECDATCQKVNEELLKSFLKLSNGDEISDSFVDKQNKYARSLIEVNKVRTLNATGFKKR